MSCWYSLVWVRHSQIVSVCTLSRSTEISQSPLSLKHTACTPPLPSPLISSASPPASPAFASPFAFFLPTSCSSCTRGKWEVRRGEVVEEVRVEVVAVEEVEVVVAAVAARHTCMSSCIEWTSQMQTVGIPIIPFFRLSGFTCPVAT